VPQITARGPISRVLSSGSLRLCDHSSRNEIAPALKRPTRTTGQTQAHMPSLFGLAPGGVCRAAAIAGARGALLPHPFTFHRAEALGDLLSVALSLGSPPPDIIRHRGSMEPGLSSRHKCPAVAQPSGFAYLASPCSRSKSKRKRIARD